MSKFILSGFGDEIDPKLTIQIDILLSHGIKNIELRGIDGKSISEFSPAYAKEVKYQLDHSGISVSGLGSPIGKIGIEDDFEPQLREFDNLLDLADIFETPYIRIFSFFIPPGDDPEKYTDQVISRIKILVDKAEKRGIILLHENEKEIYGDTPERCLKILNAINSPNLQAIFDIANFVQCDVETFPHAYNLLRPYTKYMHIKDAIYETAVVTPSGMGEGKVLEILTELSKSGYEGYVSIEPHLTDFEGLQRLEKKIDLSKLKNDGIEQFSVATNALMDVLKILDDPNLTIE